MRRCRPVALNIEAIDEVRCEDKAVGMRMEIRLMGSCDWVGGRPRKLEFGIRRVAGIIEWRHLGRKEYFCTGFRQRITCG